MKINFVKREKYGSTTFIKTDKNGKVVESNNGLYLGSVVKVKEDKLFIKAKHMKGFTEMLGLEIAGVENE